jgi:hypothetical protein
VLYANLLNFCVFLCAFVLQQEIGKVATAAQARAIGLLKVCMTSSIRQLIR